jgi:hypothetical protein
MRFLNWQYRKLDQPVPDDAELARQAAKIVEEAHQIARKRGSNVISIMKDLIGSEEEIGSGFRVLGSTFRVVLFCRVLKL